MKMGIALLPSETFSDRFIEFQHRANDIIPLYPLMSRQENIPHITLLQGRFRSTEHVSDALLQIRETIVNKIDESAIWISDVVYQPDGWYFLLVKNTDQIFRLHEMALSLLGKSMYLSEEDRRKSMEHYSDPEKQSYLKYGYRYTSDAFMPHLTIGWSKSGEDREALLKLRALFQEFEFPRHDIIRAVTSYVLGPHGAHSRTLQEVTI